jgi:hypothetical protein
VEPSSADQEDVMLVPSLAIFSQIPEALIPAGSAPSE